ncbi:hypothetical protein [Catellatospora sichuanensis]|uniref:hypothetical protein n=1 Tax=Catellatospora sichuanensis TaxID=1969805 RepID=UPI0011820AF2|nr:hypothetical protein [Catellatospora sichuanensis]
MGYRDDLDSDVQRLLNELCIKLGFCLPPDDIRRLCESPPGDVDTFTDAVFEAEGMGDMAYVDKYLRRQVREVVDRHMSRWALADDQTNVEPSQ